MCVSEMKWNEMMLSSKKAAAAPSILLHFFFLCKHFSCTKTLWRAWKKIHKIATQIKKSKKNVCVWFEAQTKIGKTNWLQWPPHFSFSLSLFVCLSVGWNEKKTVRKSRKNKTIWALMNQQEKCERLRMCVCKLWKKKES